MPVIQQSPTQVMARRLLQELRARIESIDVGITRLVELGQAPRENLFAAGSVTFGGTVGVSPSSCTVLPPSGSPPGVVLAANPHRRGLNIQNLSSTATLTIGLGQTAPQAGTGWVLAPGASWDGRVSGAMWPGMVSVVASAAGCAFCGGEVLGRNETRRRQGNLPL